jgi:hypothetical protein
MDPKIVSLLRDEMLFGLEFIANKITLERVEKMFAEGGWRFSTKREVTGPSGQVFRFVVEVATEDYHDQTVIKQFNWNSSEEWQTTLRWRLWLYTWAAIGDTVRRAAGM